MPDKATRDAVLSPDRSHLEWRKSSYSDDQGYDCVEVAVHEGQVLIRDSKRSDGPTLAFTPSEWRAFISGVKDSEFDLF
jgi:Domain of unknown function (DUF397)